MNKGLLGASLLLGALANAVLADPDLDPLVGEWSVSSTEERGDCADMRMVFDFEGNYVLRIAGDGGWQTLHAAGWRREGDLIVVEEATGSERFDVELESYERIVLVSRDAEVDRALGVGYLDLGRCAAY
ncbi:MAG: hypothetical protein VBE63_23990 [Lamprobacter sp.]|uniref:hypothetical protein n=1 Tax=Lamprobacter sp. TaxID=3100796 RepID=UPI002B26319D|nr:hypothetical protein [Lamprobacter sp.]MEA3642977.1 hypothetical protein [Lamprobacter sp.]